MSAAPARSKELAKVDAFMRLALGEAKQALAAAEIPVGCVIVRDADGVVVGRGHNNTVATGNATRHAEFEAIDNALRRAGPGATPAELFAGCTLYVTCEPCVMCAAAVRFAGFRRVCFGCRNDKFGGCGSALPIHRTPDGSRGFEIEEGVLGAEAVMLLRSFYANENINAPQPRKRHRPASGSAPGQE
ncbi:tRNA specific adenosine deaminase, partial [Pavlovales sp. CCMP2436]